MPAQKRRKRRLPPLLLLAAVLAYFFAPIRTNILILGTDDSPERGGVGRTDTIILASIIPLKPYIGMLSIPRDLWVEIPGVGEQRINTAYFFAEAEEAGSGADAAKATIHQNFGVPVRYHAVIHMSGLISFVDSLGGIDLVLDAPLGGMPAGVTHLDGSQALAFVRERSTSDDFGRMARTQALLSAVLRKSLKPSSWWDLPKITLALSQTVDTNIPVWQIPRLTFALLRAPLLGLDSRTVTREMVTPYQTAGGAQVLLPDWEASQPLLQEMFGN